MIRQISKAILPNLERDLTKSLHSSVSAMDDLMLMAPRVFSYQNKSNGSATLGAFGRTASRQQKQQDTGNFVRVERDVVSKGLFHD